MSQELPRESLARTPEELPFEIRKKYEDLKGLLDRTRAAAKAATQAATDADPILAAATALNKQAELVGKQVAAPLAKFDYAYQKQGMEVFSNFQKWKICVARRTCKERIRELATDARFHALAILYVRGTLEWFYQHPETGKPANIKQILQSNPKQLTDYEVIEASNQISDQQSVWTISETECASLEEMISPSSELVATVQKSAVASFDRGIASGFLGGNKPKSVADLMKREGEISSQLYDLWPYWQEYEFDRAAKELERAAQNRSLAIRIAFVISSVAAVVFLVWFILRRRSKR